MCIEILGEVSCSYMYVVTVQVSTDLTLTADRLKALFESVEDPDRAGLSEVNIAGEFGLPQSAAEKIKHNFQNMTQRKNAYLDAYSCHHPCPSWTKVVEVLKSCYLDKQAEEVESTCVESKLTIVNFVTTELNV